MTQDRDTGRTDMREPHPFWTSVEDDKKPTGKTKKRTDAHTTRDDNPQVELGKRKAP